MWHAPELLQRESDSGMPRQGLGGTRQKVLFEDAKPGLRCAGFEQLFAQVAGRGSPQCLQGDDLIVQLTGRQRKKGERAARFEVDAYNRRQAGRIEDDEFRMRTADQAAAKALELVVMLPVVHAKGIFAEVDDQLHRAIWKTAFPGVLLLAFVQPEHMHEGRQRLGNVGAMDCHGRCITFFCQAASARIWAAFLR